MCDTCSEWRDVDLQKLLNFKGRGYSLIDRRCHCTLTPGCPGWIHFRFLLGVYRPLWTDEAADRWMRR